MSSNFDELIHHQVKQFNRQVEDASCFHKQMLKRLCAERIRQEYEVARKPPVRIRTIGPKQPRAIVGTVLRQVGRVGQIGRRMAIRIVPMRQSAGRANNQPDVIEGEFVVLSDESNEAKTKKEEQ